MDDITYIQIINLLIDYVPIVDVSLIIISYGWMKIKDIDKRLGQLVPPSTEWEFQSPNIWFYRRQTWLDTHLGGICKVTINMEDWTVICSSAPDIWEDQCFLHLLDVKVWFEKWPFRILGNP